MAGLSCIRKPGTNKRRDRKLVLVAEDDPWIRGFMRDVLSDEGYDVIEASDGRAALRLVEERSPNILLLDIAMPEFTGVDVLYELTSRRRAPAVRVVVVTAYWRVLPANHEASVAGVVTKPFEVEDLLATVRRGLESGEDAANRHCY